MNIEFQTFEREERSINKIDVMPMSIIEMPANILTKIVAKKIKEEGEKYSQKIDMSIPIDDKINIFDNNIKLMYTYRAVSLDDKDSRDTVEDLPHIDKLLCKDIKSEIDKVLKSSMKERGLKYKLRFKNPSFCKLEKYKKKKVYLHFLAISLIIPKESRGYNTCKPIDISLIGYTYPALYSKATDKGYFIGSDKPTKSKFIMNFKGLRQPSDPTKYYFDTGDISYDINWTGKAKSDNYYNVNKIEYDKIKSTFCKPIVKQGISVTVTLKDESKATKSYEKISEKIDFKKWYDAIEQYLCTLLYFISQIYLLQMLFEFIYSIKIKGTGYF